VGAVYTIEPFVRSPDEVIDELQRKRAKRRRPRPQHKRLIHKPDDAVRFV
jgi:hypothetical protein